MAYSDDELLQLFNEQTERGYAGVYEKYWLYVYYFVLRYGTSKEDAQDITVEVFTRLFKRKKSFERLENIKAYLVTSSRNAVFDFLKLRARQTMMIEDLQLHRKEEDETYNYEVEQETIRQIMEKIDNLPNQCRLIFILAFLHERTNAEIAAQLQISEKTVRNQKHKARQHLRMTIPLRNWFRCILFFCLP